MSFNAAMLEQMKAEGLDLDACIRVISAGEKKDDPTGAERQARYRQRKRIGDGEWQRLRATVFERDGNERQYCGATEDLHCDHVVPLIQGGSNDLDNLVTACRSCNCSKSGQTPEQWAGK